jgi:hypothetical protein
MEAVKLSSEGPLEEFREASQTLALEDFKRAHAPAFLLHHGPLTSPDKARKSWQETSPAVTAFDGLKDSKPQRDFLVFPLKARPGSLFPGSISVGRARTNDIVIEHHSISKCHAHFRFTGDVVSVFDDGSTHGTFIGNNQLLVRSPMMLTSGANVRFGTVSFIILYVDEFYQLAKRLLR